MNLSNIATAKLSELKAFCRSNAIEVLGDLRHRQTWIDAAQSFLKASQAKASQVIAAATSPEARQHYKATAILSFRFVYRAFIVSCLIAIALGMSAADTWNQFRDWLESEGLTPQQPVAIVRLVIFKSRHRAQRFAAQRWDHLQDWLESQTVRAWYAVDEGVTQPAQEFKQRLHAARFVITR